MILGVLAAVGVGLYVYTQLNDEIRRHVQQVLAKNYPQFIVRVGSAQLIEGRGIEIRSITLVDPQAGDYGKLVEIDELFVVCSPTLPELLQSRFEVQQIIVRRPRLQMVRQLEGHWSYEQLLPLPKFGDGRPEIVVEGAAVELHDPLVSPARRLTLREGNFRMKPDAAVAGEPPELRRFAVEGSCAGDFFQRGQWTGRFDNAGGPWQVVGSVESVECCPELLAALPANFANSSDPLRSLRARATVHFEAGGDPSAAQPLEWRTVCQLARGRINDPRMPFPLTDVEALLRCNNGVLTVDRFNAWHGPTQLGITGQRQGLAADSPMQLGVKIRKLGLNRAMIDRLPEPIRTQLQHFSPEGELDLDARLNYDGAEWDADLNVSFMDLAVSYHKFPYQLQRTEGTVQLRDRKLSLDLRSQGDEHPIRVVGELNNPGPEATGWIEIRGSDVPIDDRLIAALPPEGSNIMRMLNPQGRMHFYWRGSRDDPHVKTLHTRLQVSLSRGAIRYSKFPYPLTNIRGTIEATDGNWTFRDLEGTNDTGFVTCNGEMLKTPQGPRLTLRFAGTEVPLEEELRDALAPSARKLWNDLRPQGRFDLTADVGYLFDARQLDLNVRIKPLGETASIEPAAFPYRLENLRGVILYENGYVSLHDVRAEHGTTRMATNGNCQMRPGGGWYLSLEKLTVDRLRVDRDLLIALPPRLRSVVGQLNPTGAVNLRGSFGLAQDAAPASPIKSQWDLTFDLHRNTLDAGVELTDLYGAVRLNGNFDGQRFQSTGELEIESLNYGTFQFTEVRGPLWIDDQRVLLGIWAQKHRGEAEPRRMTAKLYGGELASDGWVSLAAPQQFALQASVRSGDLARLSTEALPGRQNLQGKFQSDVELRGAGRGLHALTGTGNIRVYDAQIYELPLLMQLLKVLRVRVPDKTGFTQSDMFFRVEGEHVYFDKLDFLGDAMSLYGKGEMSFDKQIKLTFHSVVGRNDLPVPLLRNIVGEASGQIMRVHVGGTLENPEISNEAFPVVNQALQQLQADLGGAKPPVPVSLDPRTWNQRQ